MATVPTKKDTPQVVTGEVTPEQRESTATALAAGFTVLAGGLGIFGGLTGTVARMVRNQPELTAAAIACVLVAVTLAIASRLKASTASTFGPQSARRQWANWLLGAGLLFFIIGMACAIAAAVSTITLDDRPSVNGKVTVVEDLTTVTGTAKMGGLDADQPVYIRVFNGETQLYSAIAGANQDGLVEHEFAVAFNSTSADEAVTVIVSRFFSVVRCPDQEDKGKRWELTGCAVIQLP